jgi:hypothetical protein
MILCLNATARGSRNAQCSSRFCKDNNIWSRTWQTIGGLRKDRDGSVATYAQSPLLILALGGLTCADRTYPHLPRGKIHVVHLRLNSLSVTHAESHKKVVQIDLFAARILVRQTNGAIVTGGSVVGGKVIQVGLILNLAPDFEQSV